MANPLTSPLALGFGMGSSTKQLCLNQGAYELHELSRAQRPAADDLVLHYLRTPGDLERVRALRSQIDLSHSVGDPQFETQEKKETN
jgi:hypothetical protein